VDAGAAGNGHLDGPAIWARVNEVDPVVRASTPGKRRSTDT